MQCVVYWLGLVDYRDAYQLQKKLLQERLDEQIGDTLLLLEHPPTITVGKSGKLENILASQVKLAGEGVSLVFTDRGGDVTFHGPGQLVGYPIMDLKERNRNSHRYLHNLEETLIRTLADFNIAAHRDKGHPGVWAGDDELAAIGLRLKQWITMHGFALNINTDLSLFSLINPCGFSDRTATSMASILGKEVPIEAVVKRFIIHFSDVFGTRMELGTDKLARDYDERKTTVLV